MQRYTVTGMTCAACSARVEKAVRKVPGVSDCSVSLLTNSMGVEGTAAPETIIAAVENAGYGASLDGGGKGTRESAKNSESDALADHETPVLRRRLFASLVFLAVLMYISMGHMMWGWKLPPFLENDHVAMGLAQLVLTAIIMVINQKFFISGFKTLWNRSPNMDTLVALGSAAAFAYSTVALFAMSGAQVRGDADAVMRYMHEFYFESAAMILTLITVGKMLEARSKGKTTDALKSLIQLAPKTATLWADGVETVVPIEQVSVGDVFVVRPGESIPTDGVVLEGESAVNEAALTGESVPADKKAGDEVSAATLNTSGFLKCRATRVGENTALSQIIRMVEDAAATKAPIAKIADKVSGIFVPTVMAIAALTMVVWLFMGHPFGFALARGISVLVISCPCALGLATPVAIMVGSGVGAKHGILFKTAASLEQTGKTDIVVLDKTGTITVGEPCVTDIVPFGSVDETELLTLTASLEKQSEHPLAKAILRAGEKRNVTWRNVSSFEAMPGNGLTGLCENTRLYGGNYAFISQKNVIPAAAKETADLLAAQGKTPLFFASEAAFLGMIAATDQIKEDSPKAIDELRGMGIRVVMLTGDNERTAKAVADKVGVDTVISDVKPDGKQAVIRELKAQGKVTMVGDGINDAPALTLADTGIAIGAGTDVAIDAADVVLMKSRLSDVPAAIRLSRATLRNIHENLFWAFIYNVIGIPLAAGVFIPLTGWQLNPMFGAAAMSLSSFCVVTNALRLNLFKLYRPAKHRVRAASIKTETNTLSINRKEEKTMKKTLKIEGMMCGHCEARVKKALEALDGVTSAEVSHEKGTAIVTLANDVPNDVLKKAVEEQDYTVVSID